MDPEEALMAPPLEEGLLADPHAMFVFVCLFCRAVKKHLEVLQSLEEEDSKAISERQVTKM